MAQIDSLKFAEYVDNNRVRLVTELKRRNLDLVSKTLDGAVGSALANLPDEPETPEVENVLPEDPELTYLKNYYDADLLLTKNGGTYACGIYFLICKEDNISSPGIRNTSYTTYLNGTLISSNYTLQTTDYTLELNGYHYALVAYYKNYSETAAYEKELWDTIQDTQIAIKIVTFSLPSSGNSANRFARYIVTNTCLEPNIANGVFKYLKQMYLTKNAGFMNCVIYESVNSINKCILIQSEDNCLNFFGKQQYNVYRFIELNYAIIELPTIIHVYGLPYNNAQTLFSLSSSMGGLFNASSGKVLKVYNHSSYALSLGFRLGASTLSKPYKKLEFYGKAYIATLNDLSVTDELIVEQLANSTTLSNNSYAGLKTLKVFGIAPNYTLALTGDNNSGIARYPENLVLPIGFKFNTTMYFFGKFYDNTTWLMLLNNCVYNNYSCVLSIPKSFKEYYDLIYVKYDTTTEEYVLCESSDVGAMTYLQAFQEKNYTITITNS